MNIFPWLTKKDKLMLVFDVGSSSVGGSLFLTQKSGIPKIVKTVREPISLDENLNIDKFLFSTIKTLDSVAKKIHRSGAGKPEHIFCILSSPWYVSQTRVIKLEKNTPFLFTSKVADSLIQKEIALFEEEYLVKYKDAKSPVRSIEFKNIKTMLNGYETPSPLNQKASDLEMTIFISISPEQVLKKIEETIERYFHFKDIKFSSFAMASFAVVRDIYTNSDDFLLIDIGGEVTDISMVKNNTLRESISFPLGTNFISRRLASLLRVPLDEAESLFALFKNRHAGESVVKRLGPAIDALKIEWLSKFQASLANLSNDISIPSAIYISVDKDEADFFCQIIETEQFNQYTLTESKFKVIFLGAEIFHGMAAFDGNVVRDSALIIDSIYICRFLINSKK